MAGNGLAVGCDVRCEKFINGVVSRLTLVGPGPAKA